MFDSSPDVPLGAPIPFKQMLWINQREESFDRWPPRVVQGSSYRVL